MIVELQDRKLEMAQQAKKMLILALKLTAEQWFAGGPQEIQL
jgi:hypothetical protein